VIPGGGGDGVKLGIFLLAMLVPFFCFFWQPLHHGNPNKETNIVFDYILLILVVKTRAGDLQLPVRYLKIGEVMVMKRAE